MKNQSSALIYLVAFAAFVIGVAGMRAAADMLVPFLMAMFIAIIAAPPMQWLVARKVPKSLALFLVLLLTILTIAALTIFVGSSITNFTKALPEYKSSLSVEMNQISQLLARYGIDAPSVLLQQYLNPAKAMDLVSTLFSGLGNVLTNSILILLTVAFILAEVSSFPHKFHAAFANGSHYKRGIDDFLQNIKKYVAIKTLMSALTGLLAFLWLAIIQVDYAFLWGLLAFLLNYVPNIGSILAAVPAVILAFLQLGGWEAGLTVLVYTLINMGIGNILEPRYMGKGLGLSTLVVFVSLIFWGWVFGAVGMLLSVPLTMVAKIALASNPSTRWLAVLLDSESAYEKS